MAHIPIRRLRGPSPRSYDCATSMEVGASSGTVMLTSIADRMSATGSFNLTLPGGTLNGTCSAGYCDIGVEP
jgi:hypothetical protein